MYAVFQTGGKQYRVEEGDVISTISIAVSSIVTVIIIALFVFSAVSISKIVKPLQVVENTIIGIAQGDADLTQRVNVVRNDEIGRLVNGFNLFAEKLQNIVSNVMQSKNKLASAEGSLKQSVENTGCSITEILCNIESVSHLVETQADGVEETAGAVTKIADNISKTKLGSSAKKLNHPIFCCFLKVF